MNDPRQKLPSASAAKRDALCAGAFLASRDIPDLPNPWSKSGTQVHEVFLSRDEEAYLDSQQRDVHDRARAIEDKVLTSWENSVGIVGDYEYLYSERFWAKDNRGQPICSGEVDALFITQDRSEALIEDLKSLYGDVDDSTTNEQLRDLAVLVWINHDRKPNVTCFINQPLVTSKPVLTRYTQVELLKAEILMRARVARSMDPTSKRTPSPAACKWCKAKPVCPEALADMTSLVSQKLESWDVMVPERKLWLWDRCVQVEALVKDIKEHIAKDLAKDPDAIPGLAKEPDGWTRSVFDAAEMKTVLMDGLPFGGTIAKGRFSEEFDINLGIKIGDLEALISKHFDLSKDEAKKLLEKHGAKYLEKKPRRGSIVRTKE